MGMPQALNFRGFKNRFLNRDWHYVKYKKKAIKGKKYFVYISERRKKQYERKSEHDSVQVKKRHIQYK